MKLLPALLMRVGTFLCAIVESYLHQGIDPALLEHAGGRRFSARVFPIEPGAPKRLIIAYSQTLPDDAVLVPLRGLPQLGSLDVEVSVVNGPTERFARKQHQPVGDIGLDPAWRRARDGVYSRDLLLARMVVIGDGMSRDKFSAPATPSAHAMAY